MIVTGAPPRVPWSGEKPVTFGVTLNRLVAELSSVPATLVAAKRPVVAPAGTVTLSCVPEWVTVPTP